MPLSDRQLRQLQEVRDNLPLFAERFLRIRNKAGDIVPFKFNDAQMLVHERLQRQVRDRGLVRAVIAKGRQGGFSTYVAARFYHRACMHSGVNVYILSHEQMSAASLFGIVDRYQKYNPMPPHVGVSNAKELVFDRLESTYTVATAGQKAGGRSRTVSLFHGSEVAYWKSAADHFAASVQTVPYLPGTEIILESTSSEPIGEWYDLCQDARNGDGDYEMIFVPWTMSREYTREVPPGFTLEKTPEREGDLSEEEYMRVHKLSLGQMVWRRKKISELKSAQKFCQEYPTSLAESFTSANTDSFIPSAPVTRARKNERVPGGPLIFGVDPASTGGDRFTIAARRGNKVLWVARRRRVTTTEGRIWLEHEIGKHRPDRVYIDLGNIGAAIYSDMLLDDPAYGRFVRGVNFGDTSELKKATPNIPGPRNRRAEMYCRLKTWLEDPAGVDIPDDDALQADITAVRQKFTSANDYLLESKREMRDRGIKSPDEADAVALTFASFEIIAPSPRGFDGATGTPVGMPAPSREPVVTMAGDNSWMC